MPRSGERGGTGDRRGSAWTGNLLLVLASLAVLAAMGLASEAALRGLGVAEPQPATASRLRFQHLVLPVLTEDRRPDGVAVWRTADARLPYQAILREKPADGLRVVVFGGSAAAGLGFSPNASFARSLERLLRRAHPERTVEVLNLGIVALASEQVKLLVDEVSRRYAPDVAVVYSGNNEFLELHAGKYARARGGPAARALEILSRSRVYRALAALGRDAPGTPSLAGRPEESWRLTQREIVREVETSPAEVAERIDAYEANLDAMVDAASAHGAGILLATVASNWRWRGRSDLPEGWAAELVGEAGPAGAAHWGAALGAIEARLAGASRDERHEWLFRRAAAHEALGEFDAARRDYRAALNADPHLRRALDAMNERVLGVAGRRGVAGVDLVAALARDVPHGIVGFETFYDYVHFTPSGAVRAAAALFEALEEEGLVARGTLDGSDVGTWVAEELAWLASLRRDPPEVERWLGFGFDRSGIADRNLWKYDELRADLDARIERDPHDVLARTYRGNLHSFQRDGAADAAADYRAALTAGGGPEVRRNLERLEDERRL